MAEARKRRAYGDPARHPYAFVPFAVSSYGRLGLSAMAYVGRLAARVADRSPGDAARVRATFVDGMLRELSASLARSTGRIYAASLKLRARAAGRNFRACLPAPSELPLDD